VTAVRRGTIPTEDTPRPGPEIPLHELLDLRWEAPEFGSDTAIVTMPVRPGSFGFNGNLHGGAIATMVDLACALAATQATEFDMQSTSLVTTDLHLRYLGRPATDTVRAVATVVRAGGQLVVVECRVSDTDGKVVALCDTSMMLVSRRRSLADDAVVAS